jgi:hypothetical protein
MEQITRKSATECNQDFNNQEELAPEQSGETEKR